jgi:AcrR family transcriptional regulator
MRDYGGKSAAERTAERRARLIEAGLEMFGDQGYAGTSIRGVLSRAGLRDRYFSESFPDLDSLLAAVFDRIIDEEVAVSRAAIDTASSPSEAVRAIIDGISKLLENNPRHARVKLRETLSAGPVTRQRRRAGMRRLAAHVADLLPPTPPGSELDRLMLATGVVATANELLITWLDDDGEPHLTREDVVNLVTLMFDAIADQITASSGRPAQDGAEPDGLAISHRGRR